MFTQVLKFGVRSLLEHRDEALAEIVEAHWYYNRLIDNGNVERATYREIRSTYVPALDLAEQKLEELNAAIEKVLEDVRLVRKKASAPKNGKAAKPTKIKATPEQKQKLDDLKAERKLVAVEAKLLRAKFEALLAPARQAFDARTSGASSDLLEAINEAGKALKEAKRIRNNPEVPKLKAHLEALKARKKKVSPATHKKRAINAKVFEEMLAEDQWSDAWKAQKTAEVRAKENLIQARAASGLTHGTYTAVELAVEQAFKEAEGDPRRKSLSHTGGRKVGRQISGKPLTGAAFYAGTDSRLKVTQRGKVPLGRKEDQHRVPRGATSLRNFREYVIVSLPLGKAPNTRWVSFEVNLHRRIPLDAEITWVYLVPSRVGFETQYSLQLTVNTERPIIQREPGTEECHVRLRWSRDLQTDKNAQKHGIIVAEINGEPFAMDGAEYQGRHAKVTAPEKRKPNNRKRRGFEERGGAYAGLLKSRALRSQADIYFEGHEDAPEEGARRALIQWMESHKAPDWLKEMTAPKPATATSKAKGGLKHWRQHGPLALVALRWVEEIGIEKVRGLWAQWRAYRDDLNEDYYTTDRSELNEWLNSKGVTSEFECMGIWLEWWRCKDRHLLQWSANSQRKALENRKDQYRVKAAQLATRYKTVVLHDFDLAEAAKRKTPDQDENELHRQARYQRVAACPSQFKEALRLAFGPDRYTSVKCEKPSADETPGVSRKSSQPQKSVDGLAQDTAAE